MKYGLFAALVFLLPSQAEDTQTVLLAARRAKRIEIINPENLDSLGSIILDRRAEGVSGGAGPRKVFIELAGSDAQQGGLFELNLETRKLARIDGMRPMHAPNGTRLWREWGFRDFDTSALGRKKAVYLGYERLHPSPDGRWLMGIGNWRESVLDIFDVRERKFVRRLPVPDARPSQVWPLGAWMDSRFFVYVQAGTVGKLRLVTPETEDLGPGISVAINPGNCREPDQEMLAAGGRLFLFEIFGSTLDRRRHCGTVAGGVYLIDPSTGAVLGHFAPLFHFWQLIAGRDGRTIYGLDAGDADWRTTVRLVKIDAESGAILAERSLETDVWHFTLADLSTSLVPE